MALSSLEYYYKKKNGKLAEDKEDSANTTTKRKSSLESYYEKSLMDRIGLDTFNDDLTRANETLNSITGGWQSADYLNSSRPELESMLDRSKAYKSYVNRNSSEDLTDFNASMDSLISTYESVLNDYDNIANYYGGFKNADAYTNYQKVQEEKEKEAQKSAFDEYRHLLEDSEFMSKATYDDAVGGNSTLNFIKGKLYDGLTGKKTDDYVASVVKNNNADGFFSKIDQAVQSTFPNEHTHLQYLTDEEEQVYYGLLARDGSGSANEFLEKMKPELNKRMTNAEMGRAEKLAQKNGVLGVAASLGSLGSNLIGGVMSTASDVSNYIKGEDVDANDYMHLYSNRGQAYQNAVSGKISENHGNVASFLYDTAISIGNTAVNALSLGGTGAMVNMGMQAYASKAKEMQDMGASDTEIILTGALAGGIEALTEKVSLGNLLKPKGITSIKTLIKETAKQMGIEASEEWVSEVLNQTVDVLNGFVLNGTSSIKADYEDYLLRGYTEEEARNEVGREALTEQLMSAIGGAISGGVMGGISSGMEYGDNRNLGSFVTSNNRVEDLASLASRVGEIDGINYGEVLADNPNKATIGNAYKQVAEKVNTDTASTIEAETKEQITRRLVEMGEGSDSAMAISDAIIAKQKGTATKAQQKLLNESGNAADVMKDIREGADWTQRTTEATRSAMNLRDNLQRIKVKKSDSTVVAQENMKNMNVSDDTTDLNTGKHIDLEGARFAENGDIILQTSEGERNISEVTLTSNDAMVVSIAQDMTDKQESDLFISLYDGKQNVEDYKDSFELAWSYGKDGFGSESVLSHLGNLTPTQANVIYSTAMMSEVGRKHSKLNLIKNQYKEFKSEGHYDDSIIDYTGTDSSKVNFDSLKDNQKQNLIAAKVVAKEFGIDVKLFSSRHGEEKSNGYYDPKENAIYIDVYAEQRGGSLHNGIMTAMSHELTHWMKEKSPKLYAEMRELVMNNLSKYSGLSGTTLVAAEVNRMNDRHGNGTTEGAIDEYIARACEDMLSNSKTFKNALENMSEETRNSFVDKVKVMLSKIKEAISELLGRFDSKSAEAVALREMDGVVDRLAELWDNALQEAIEVNHAMGASRNDMSQMAASDKEALANVGVATNGEMATMYSVKYVLDDNGKDRVASMLSKSLGVSKEEAMDYLVSETSLASVILNPKYSELLNYEADGGEVAIKTNSDYPQGTVDFSNICTKRRDFTSVMNKVMSKFKNHVFMATDLAKIRTIMSEEGITIPCGICYVEDRRQLDSIVAEDFQKSLELYRSGSTTRPDGKPFNAQQLKALKMVKGNYKPSVYELITLEGRNKLKAKNPAMENAWVTFNNARGMQSVRLLLNEAEYKREILDYSPATVETKNNYGGLRLYSFSDAEMIHLIDIIQVITDSSAVGLKLQGYTKVNEYAKAVKDTREKLNRSLIPLGDLGYHMENGKVVLDYDTVEGIDINHKDFFDSTDNPDVGNITIGINDVQIRAAMTDSFVDYIIPFHTGQSGDVLKEKGIGKWKNYKNSQSERNISNGKKSEKQINIYTDVINASEQEGNPITNKVQFVEKFLSVCKENGLIPRFSEFLNVDENGDYVYTEGYHKFIIDFKMFHPVTGEYLPQMPVVPSFNNDYIQGLLTEYAKNESERQEQLSDKLKTVVKRIEKEIITADGRQYSDRNYHYDDNGVVVVDIRQYSKNRVKKHYKDDVKDTVRDFLEGLAGKQVVIKSDNRVVLFDAVTADEYTGSNATFGAGVNERTAKMNASVALEKIVETAKKPKWFANTKPKHNKDAKRGWTYYELSFGLDGDTEVDYYKARLVIRMDENGNDYVYDVDGISFEKKEAKHPDLTGVRSASNFVEQATKSATSTTNNIVTDSKDMSSKKQYSDKDSDGNTLSVGQMEYFKDSKVRDDNGNLMVMYHGTEKAGFTVFDNRFSDDGRSFFFTSSPIVAKGYSGSYDDYIPSSDDAQFKSIDDYREFFSEYGEYELTEEDGEYVLTEDSGIYTTEVARFPDIADVYDEFLDYKGLKQASGNYKTYLNLKNPLIVDAKNNNWDEVPIPKEYLKGINESWDNPDPYGYLHTATTRQLSEYAYENGYDGVIIENLYDTAIYASNKEKFVSSTVAIAFNSNQIKSVANANPTDADDIRHSDKGDFETMAQKVKRLEREKEAIEIRHQNYKDNVKKRAKIEQITNKAKRMNDLLKKNSKDYHVPEILKKPLEAVLSSIDFSSKTLLTKGVPTGKDIKLVDSFDNLRKTLYDINEVQIAQKDIEGIYGHFDMPENFVKYVEEVKDSINATIGRMDSEPVVLNRLTKEELDAVYDILTIINKSIRQMDMALSSAKHEKISSLSRSSKAFLDSIDKKDSELALMKNLKTFLSWENVLPAYAMSRFGDGGDRVFRFLQDGWDKLAFNVNEVVKFTESVYSPNQLKEWEQSTKTFTVENGGKKKDITLTDAQIMSLYCLAKREQAMGHLLESGITIGSYEKPADGVKKVVDKVLKRTYAKDDALLTEKEIKTITSSLTMEQIAVADKLQKFMNDVCAEWGNQVTMVRFGIKSFGEENYFPIQSDSNNIGAEAKEKGNTLFRLLNLSFTKSLTKNANNKIMVNSIFDVFANHASDMAKYNALALPVLDAYKWYSYHEKTRDDNGRIKDDWSLRKHMDNAYGESAQKYVRRLLEDINGQSSGGQDIAEGWARKLMSNYKIASVAANLRVAVLQPTSYVRAGLLLDKKYLSKALYTNEATIKESVKKARETCGIALWKSMGFYDTNISKGVTKMIKHDESRMDTFKDKSMILAEKGDEMTWGLLYRACLLEQKDKGLRGEELDKAVAERLRDVIYKTQVVDSTLTRTQTMRSKNAWSQILTSFMSEPSVSWSMLSDAVFKWAVEARNGNQKAAFKKYGNDIKNASLTYLITTTVASLISSLPDTFRDDDEDEEFIEKYVLNVLGNAIPDFTGLLPVVRDIFNSAQGYKPTRMDQEAFGNLFNGIKRLFDGEVTYKDVYTTAKGVSQLSGLPFSNVMREFATLWNNTIGQIYPSLKLK